MKFRTAFCFVSLYLFSSLSYSQTLQAFLQKDLNFGDVFIGYSEEVSFDDDRAAEFLVFHTSRSARNLLITFDLPNNLTNGTDQLPIVFSRRHAAWSDSRDGRQRKFNPNNPLERRQVNANRELFIWLGGKINANNNNLSSGKYTGTIILTVEYL